MLVGPVLMGLHLWRNPNLSCLSISHALEAIRLATPETFLSHAPGLARTMGAETMHWASDLRG